MVVVVVVVVGVVVVVVVVGLVGVVVVLIRLVGPVGLDRRGGMIGWFGRHQFLVPGGGRSVGRGYFLSVFSLSFPQTLCK